MGLVFHTCIWTKRFVLPLWGHKKYFIPSFRCTNIPLTNANYTHDKCKQNIRMNRQRFNCMAECAYKQSENNTYLMLIHTRDSAWSFKGDYLELEGAPGYPCTLWPSRVRVQIRKSLRTRHPYIWDVLFHFDHLSSLFAMTNVPTCTHFWSIVHSWHVSQCS